MDDIWWFEPKRCAKCGKEIFIYDKDWAYKDHRGYYCSWSCLRSMEKQEKKQDPNRKKVEQLNLSGEIVATYDNYDDAAFAVSGCTNCVVLACKGKYRGDDGHRYKGYLWRYKENDVSKVQE